MGQGGMELYIASDFLSTNLYNVTANLKMLDTIAEVMVYK